MTDYLSSGFTGLLSRFLQTLAADGRSELPWPGNVGSPINIAARGNGGFAILTNEGYLVVFGK